MTPKLKPTSKRTVSALSWRRRCFKDPFAVERIDDREDYGEERFVSIGMAEGHILLFVAYTERNERIRIISARRATQYEQDDYFRQDV